MRVLVFIVKPVKKVGKESVNKMKYFILISALCLAGCLALEFDRPCRDDVPAKEFFNPNFVSSNV